MPRHEFWPGRLIAGLALASAGVAYAGDGGGWWSTPWFVIIPIVVGGLCLAAAAGMTGRAVRRRRQTRPTAPASSKTPL
ncbi:integral membrane protein [Streptomyces griseoaurantiacus M045]|uniref:Integral membrane protein n=1 Tax=Streptomyces griseoaurantiacus M045 TaxID=996637 RepID=F3NIQ2_9ACTN|nr:hypothetical protein [Streptomyces griseoaurantiacus]EGG46527.1 integral membrane protein [Streptomyces griseoaurantiacus M045]